MTGQGKAGTDWVGIKEGLIMGMLISWRHSFRSVDSRVVRMARRGGRRSGLCSSEYQWCVGLGLRPIIVLVFRNTSDSLDYLILSTLVNAAAQPI